MQYDLPVWRPPSEARSFILQVTLGCSHNRCTFCHMYLGKRFRVRPLADIARDVKDMARRAPDVRRVFLADGDPLAAGAGFICQVAGLVREAFPRLERLSAYCAPQNLLRKRPEALRAIREAGVSLLYFGVETGDPETLAAVDKGVTADELVAAADRAHAAGFELSCTVLLGLAGPAASQRHAAATAAVISRIDPAFVGALSIMVPEQDQVEYPLRRGVETAPWLAMQPMELVRELRTLVAGLECTRAMFRSNHASNYLPLGGTLPGDRPKMLAVLDRVIAAGREDVLRPEWMRGL